MTIPTLTLFVKGFKNQFPKLVKTLVPQASEACSYSPCPAPVISVPSVGTVRQLGSRAYNPKNSGVGRLFGQDMY